jgi:hypothetical protein
LRDDIKVRVSDKFTAVPEAKLFRSMLGGRECQGESPLLGGQDRINGWGFKGK